MPTNDASPAQTRWLDRPGGRIAFDVTGTGPLVVCVPGMGDLRSSYRFTTPALVAAGFTVATLDLRGHGDSDATFSSYDDVAAAGDVVALLELLGGPALVVGNSMGAGAAVLAAAARADLVRALALLGPFVRNSPINPLLRVAFRAAMAGPWARAAWTSYVPKLFPARRPADLPDHIAAISEGLRRPGHLAAFRATTRTSHEPVREALGDVHVPTLVVMGAADPDFADPAAEAAWITEQLSAEQMLVADAGHYPHVEFPEIVNPALVDFAGATARA